MSGLTSGLITGGIIGVRRPGAVSRPRLPALFAPLPPPLLSALPLPPPPLPQPIRRAEMARYDAFFVAIVEDMISLSKSSQKNPMRRPTCVQARLKFFYCKVSGARTLCHRQRKVSRLMLYSERFSVVDLRCFD